MLLEDEVQKERVAAKNALEAYCYNMKQTAEDEKLAADKISAEDKALVLTAVADTLRWLDSSQAADKQEYEHKLKELEQVCNPVVIKLYRGEPEGKQEGKPQAGQQRHDGPKIDEVD